MRFRIRIILPTVQVLIAAALIACNEHRPAPTGEDTIGDSRDFALDIQSCWALNAPAAMIARIQRAATHDLLWTHYPLDVVVDLGVLFLLVWLLWYAVAVEITGRGLSVLSPRTGIRRVADVLAIILGAFVVPYADRVTMDVLAPYQKVLACVYLLWTLAIIGFYGRDLLASFRTTPGVTNNMGGI